MFKAELREKLNVDLQKEIMAITVLEVAGDYLEAVIGRKYTKRIAMALETELKEKLGKEFTVTNHKDRNDYEYVRINISSSIFPDNGEVRKFSGLDFITLKILKINGFLNLESLKECIYHHMQLSLRRKKDILLAIENLDSLYAESKAFDQKLCELYNRIPSCLKHISGLSDIGVLIFVNKKMPLHLIHFGCRGVTL